MEKPDVLSDKEVAAWVDRKYKGKPRSAAIFPDDQREAQRDFDAAYYEPLIQQAEDFYRRPFVTFRQDIRNLLAKRGVLSNPGWTESDIVSGIEKAIQQARQEVAREIFEDFKRTFYDPDTDEWDVNKDDLQFLESKYVERKEGK